VVFWMLFWPLIATEQLLNCSEGGFRVFLGYLPVFGGFFTGGWCTLPSPIVGAAFSGLILMKGVAEPVDRRFFG